MRFQATFLGAVLALTTTLHAQEFLPGKIINKKTGESIAIECVDKNEDQCLRIRYYKADSEDGAYTQISQDIEVGSIEEALKETKTTPELTNIFHSKRLFAFSESSDMGFSLLYKDEGRGISNDGGMTVDFIKEWYKRGANESTGVYVLHAAGATVGAAVVGALGVYCTAVFGAIDVVLLPIRGVGKLVSPNKKVTGKDRRNLKTTDDSQTAVLDGPGNIYLKNKTWKKVLEGVQYLDVL